jgi:hypothetical protein
MERPGSSEPLFDGIKLGSSCEKSKNPVPPILYMLETALFMPVVEKDQNLAGETI